MRMRRVLAWFSLFLLLLLMLLQSENSCFAHGYSTFSRFKKLGSSVSHRQRQATYHPAKSQGNRNDFRANANNNKHGGGSGGGGDEIFGAEKRKVYTGPNPLHNR